jgi:hypothetical protein
MHPQGDVTNAQTHQRGRQERRRVLAGEGKHACLKSSGIAHATKSKIELGVAGKDGWFDDIKVWNAEPAKR